MGSAKILPNFNATFAGRAAFGLAAIFQITCAGRPRFGNLKWRDIRFFDE